MNGKLSSLRLLLLSVAALMLLSGCMAGQAAFNKGNAAMAQEDYDQAIVEYLAATDKNPGRQEYRLQLRAAVTKSAMAHKIAGDDLFAQQRYAEAYQEYRLAAELDGSLYVAIDRMRDAQTRMQAEALLREAEALLQGNRTRQAAQVIDKALTLVPDHQRALELKGKIRTSQFALVDGVELEVTSTQLIDLNFKDTKLPDAFEIITRLSGINFILDEDVRNDKTTLFLEKATFAQALELMLRMNKLDKKILNSKTIILYPKTRDKQKQFDDQIIQTFYLSHLEAKEAVNMLRTLLQVRKVYVQEGLNAIVIRDQPEVIKLAQKLIEANDRQDSEVVFDLELIEVNHSDTQDLGLTLSKYSVGAALTREGKFISDAIGSSTENLVPLDGSFKGIYDTITGHYTLPSATFKFAKTLVDAEVLASPKIRVRNKEKAKVNVGSREPIITTTTNGDVTSTSVQYIDVGVKLDVQPTIQLDNTIVTKLGLEVSNVTGTVETDDTTAIIISSTNADTVLTLKDGEQTVIGGLIRDDTSNTKQKIPILGDIPLLGEAFTGTDKSKKKREILLSITPHIVKSVVVPQGDVASIWSGGEDDFKLGRNFGTFADEYAGQVGIDADSDDEADNLETETAPQPAPDVEPAPVVEPQQLEQPQAAVEPPVESMLATPAAGQDLMPMLFVEGPQLVKSGEEFTLNFMISEVTGLVKTPLAVSYDPAVLKPVAVREGTFLNRDGAQTLFTTTELDGKVVIALEQEAGGKGQSGGGLLFQMKFKAVGPGNTEIIPNLGTFSDAAGQPVTVDNFGLLLEVAR